MPEIAISRVRGWGWPTWQDVDVGAQGLEGFLVFDAEALLLVDDDQAELLEGDRAGQQRVGADDQVNLA